MSHFRIGAFAALLCVFIPAAQTQKMPAPSQPPANTPPQTEQVLASYEGQNVSSVEIGGDPKLDVNQLMPLLPQKAGEPFSQKKVDASVAALQATGRFKGVQLRVVPDIKGVRVLLIVQPGMYFGMYSFPGALKQFPYSQLLQVSNYPPEGPYTKADVTNAAASLQRYFQRNGFFLAKVNPTLETDRTHGIVNVIFNTELGRHADFGKVTIEGTTPQESAHLRGVLHSILARLRGSAIREGKTYHLSTVQNATNYLQSALADQAHLAATVKLIGANYDPETNRADVVFHVTPGPKINVKVQGAHVWSWDKHKLLPVYQQVGVDQEIIQEGRQNLVSYFQKKGYFDAKVTVDVTKEPKGEVIAYHIEKGPRHKVSEVTVAGNHALSDDELMPAVTVQEGSFLPFLSHGSYSEKLVHQTVNNLEAIYKAAGFSSVKVTPQVKTNGGNLDVTFHVNEGPRDIVASLNVVGNETVPVSQLAPKGLNEKAGNPYSQKLVDQDRTQLMAKYLQLGYLTANFRETVSIVDKNKHRVAVTYHISEGPRVITTNIVTVGGKHTKQSFIDRTAQLQPKQPMREDEMLAAESRLYEPGIFDWAEVDPRRQITTQNREELVVKVHEARRNSIMYGFGFEVIKRGGSIPSGTVTVPGIPPVGLSKNFKTAEKTFYGPRGSFEYTRMNLFGRAETVTFGALAGRLDQRGNLTFQDPHFRGTNWQWSISGTGEHDSTNPIFTSRVGQGSTQFQHALNPDRTQNLFLRYTYNQTGLTRLLATFSDLVPPSDRHVRQSTVAASYIRDTRDSVLDAHKGMYETAEFGVTPTWLGSSVNYTRFFGQAAYYKTIPHADNIVWANSLRLGLEHPFSNSHVPLAEQFFSGGGSTLRGFPLDGAGPQRHIAICNDPSNCPANLNADNCFAPTCSITTVPVGGNALAILNSEFRIPVPLKDGLGVVAFYDGGNVFQTLPFQGQWTHSIGAGIRYATPVGPVRIDIGHLLNAPPGVGGIQYFITLGQAF